MVAKMAKLLEKSKINQKIFIKEKDNKVFLSKNTWGNQEKAVLLQKLPL